VLTIFIVFGRPYYRSRLWHIVSSVCLVYHHSSHFRAVLNYAGDAGDLLIEAWRSWKRGSRHMHWFARGSHNG